MYICLYAYMHMYLSVYRSGVPCHIFLVCQRRVIFFAASKIHTCIYIDLYTCLCAYVSIYVYTCIYIDIYIYASVHRTLYVSIYIYKYLLYLATSFWSATAASFSSPRPKFGSCHPPRVLPTSCARQPVFRPPLRGAPRRRRRENESRASASLSPLDRRSLGSRGAVRNKRFVLWRIYKKNKKMPLITISRGCFWERSSQASASPSPLDRRLPDSRGVVRKKKELYVRKDLQKKKKNWGHRR